MTSARRHSARLCVRRIQTQGPPWAIPHSEFHIPQSTGSAFGNWEKAGMVLETQTLLTHQLQRSEVEYRVIGVNSAGISVPSNTVAVVL